MVRERERIASIAGGFVLVDVRSLIAAWRACQARPLGAGDFRTMLACREMVARRCQADEDRSPAYGYPELARLLGVTERRARSSVSRLAKAGLLEWAEGSMGFPVQILEDEKLLDTIGRGRGSLAIPRRMLRHLADGARPALIATALGMLLRCLSRRRDGFDGRGRLKVGWVAETFGLGLRQVKAARIELESLGWIGAEESDNQWTMNRFGRAYRIDLGWAPPGSSDGPRSAPLPAVPGARSAPPDLHREPLREGNQNQEPVRTGVGVRTGDQEKPPAPPRLDDIRPADLDRVERTLDLHRQAVAKGLVTGSEHDRLRFVALAVHCRSGRNPGGLFAALLRRGAWAFITQSEEDAARRRLRAHDHPPLATGPARSVGPSAPRPSTLSEDARVVKAVREATIRAGIFRDPFPAMSSRDPAWDRERWDRALAELGFAARR